MRFLLFRLNVFRKKRRLFQIRNVRAFLRTFDWYYLFLIILCLGCQSRPSLEGDIIIENVTIVDVENGELRPSQTVVVKADKIISITNYDPGANLNAPTVIAGGGKFLIPGLWDMHFHTSGDHLMSSAFYPLFIADGITGVREMSGFPEDFKTIDSIQKELFPGPGIILGSRLINGMTTWPDAAISAIITSESEARNIVDTLKKQGFDFVKPYSFLTRENYLALSQRAEELDMEISGHIPNQVSAFEAIKLGQRTIEHMIGLEISSAKNEEELRAGFKEELEAIQEDTPEDVSRELFLAMEIEPVKYIDPEKEDSLFTLIANSETWVVPTLILQNMISYPDDPEFSNEDFEKLLDPSYTAAALEGDHKSEGRLRKTVEYRMRSIKKLHEMGGKILAGTDMRGGGTLHKELELMVRAGLSPAEALRTATINPAEYLNRSEELGTVEEGKTANLVLLNANPLKNIRNIAEIEAVINRGTLYNKEELDSITSSAISAIEREK